MPNGELPEEYLEYLKRSISSLEKFGDALTGVDERVDYVVRQLAELKITPETIAALTEAVDRLEEMGLVMPTRTEQLTFRETLEPLQGLKLEEVVPLDGKITSVTFHWPDGCDSLVDVTFGYASEQICPSEGTLALNDATPVFPVSQEVKKDDKLWTVMENGDGDNDHTISVIVTIEGR